MTTPPRTREQGSITVWMLGLSILLLSFGGLSIDFWRALALQRQLAAVADSAAISAAAGIDEAEYRASGQVTVDPSRAVDLGTAYVSTRDVELAYLHIDTSANGAEVSVEVAGDLELGLMGLFVPGDDPLVIRARATATPVRLP
ncbi:MAG: pilus assembly protein TadG-related protein [Acidimicrobiia bacterium]